MMLFSDLKECFNILENVLIPLDVFVNPSRVAFH